MKKVLSLLMLACFVSLPMLAQDAPTLEELKEMDTSAMSREELKEHKKALKEAKKAAKSDKKLERAEKKRAGLKFKWAKSLKAGLSVAEKRNTTCLVLYSDPKNCKYCAQMDEEIFESKEFKSAKGIGVGFRSEEPVEDYNLSDGMPAGVLVNPEGEVIYSFKGYDSAMTPDSFVKLLQEKQPKIELDKDDK